MKGQRIPTSNEAISAGARPQFMTVYADPNVSQTSAAKERFTFTNWGEAYLIPNVDRLDPFLITLTSESDLWTFISSSGGLTAGRVNRDHALFPYETEDRLHHAYGITGPITLIRVRGANGRTILWEPFSPTARSRQIERNLYKSPLGNRLTFEEIHQGLGLRFGYTWMTSSRYGLIRSAQLINEHKGTSQHVEVLDGLLNILPSGVNFALQQTFSVLTDAYKQNELDESSGLATFSLTSCITDRAEPNESLTTTTAWSRGLENASIFLTERAVSAFRLGRLCSRASTVHGERGAFLQHARFTLTPQQRRQWDVALDVDQDHSAVARRRKALMDKSDELQDLVTDDVAASEQGLREIVARVDGLQLTSEPVLCAHHLANVLFNSMRGGIPLDEGAVRASEFSDMVRQRNREVWLAHRAEIESLPPEIRLSDLLAWAELRRSPDLLRLACEYLPLTFGRRHGDPSRPWNQFNIRLRNADGSPRVGYEGNWRDIFQNWEALALSYPSLLERFIAKFVNASTVDGFNPYRISSEGLDWEVPNPDDPWSHIGYWGDHQVIYLLKFLEWSSRHHPRRLRELLHSRQFSYADVPYRLKPYAQILENPRETIDYDTARAQRIARRLQEIGSDAKLVQDKTGKVYHVNLLEKLLVPLLSKLSNLVPGAGIWMNTQRPEWNDANNALSGYGVSVVTLAYLLRYVRFMRELVRSDASQQRTEVSIEVARWLREVSDILSENSSEAQPKNPSPGADRAMMDALGQVFEKHRNAAYLNGFSGTQPLEHSSIDRLLSLAESHIQQSLEKNRRDDGLFHSYNLLEFLPASGDARIHRLDEMLEGQVAILSSGLLSTCQTIDLLRSMFASGLYRPDQQTFMLYPRHPLVGFQQRNRIDPEAIRGNPLLSAHADAGETLLVEADVDGVFHFNASLHNRADVERAVGLLKDHPRWGASAAEQENAISSLFDDVFHHRGFTGRSGAMVAYEGVGCVYWHMVAKLLLAVQECYFKAVESNAGSDEIQTMAELYHRVRAGMGFNKSARNYGAFPTDPYSHTPAIGGARQPGMTGQVKEEILTRRGEWGVIVEGGQLRFEPRLLRREEFLRERAGFGYLALDGQWQSLELEPDSAAFTVCQVPILYHLGSESRGAEIEITRKDGVSHTLSGTQLDADASAHLFSRSGEIRRIDVRLANVPFSSR